jgi:hypothetical protein
MATGAARELAAGSRLAADRGRDFLEAEAEHVMKQEGSALQRRQALQRHQQGQGHVVDLVLSRFHNRLGQPRADVGLAPTPDRLEPVQAQARDDPAQKCFRFAHRVSVDIEPAQESVLKNVLRLRDRAQHPVRNADKTLAQRIEDGGGILARGGCHQAAAFFSSAGWTARKPILIRFQALTCAINKVSFTCSSSVKCWRSAS